MKGHSRRQNIKIVGLHQPTKEKATNYDCQDRPWRCQREDNPGNLRWGSAKLRWTVHLNIFPDVTAEVTGDPSCPEQLVSLQGLIKCWTEFEFNLNCDKVWSCSTETQGNQHPAWIPFSSPSLQYFLLERRKGWWIGSRKYMLLTTRECVRNAVWTPISISGRSFSLQRGLLQGCPL